MPRGRLYKDSHRLGFNTRDNPQDIPFESCQSLVNLFPGHPSPTPRFGTDKWNTNILPGAVKKSIPWADDSAPKVVLHIGNGLYWQAAGGGTLTTIDASIVPANSKLSWIRTKDMLLINTNLTGDDHRAWYLEWTGSTFSIRNANIDHPTLSISATNFTGDNLLAERVRIYTATLVNRDDAASIDGLGQPKVCRLQDGNFHPGLLESIEVDDNRYAFTAGVSDTAVLLEFDRGAAVLDTQATHLRIYTTVSAASATVARGLDLRWLADIPIKGDNAYAEPWEYIDSATDGEMTGSLNLLKTPGYEEIPPGAYMKFHNGRVWVGGVGTGEELGRNFYSETPQDVEFPQKWWSMFNKATLFKDTSYEDAEPAMGLAVSGNDMIMFMGASLWYLRDGDPDFEPARISKTKGTRFPGSITEKDNEVLYISNEGPAAVVGRDVEPLQAHTAGEVWPRLFNNATGYFFGLADKTVVEGWYFQETWWLSDGVKLIGMYMPSMRNAIGPLSIEFADTSIGFGKPCVLSENLCILASSALAGFLWNFLNRSVSQDNGTNYWLKCKSKALYVSQRDRDRCGEVFNLKVLCHFEDTATLFLEFISDFYRFDLELAYREYSTTNPLQSAEARVQFRNLIEQPFPEGMVFSFCEIVWRKEHRTPWSYSNKGFILEYKPLEGHVTEFISRDRGDGLVEEWPDELFHAKFDDNSGTLTDFSPYGRHHAYSAGTGGSRTADPDLVPHGGQSLVAGVGSGYSDADWNGMDYMGDAAGFNSQPLAYEYVMQFPSLAAAVVIQEGGDGTNFWRLRVNTDGSLEYQIKVPGLPGNGYRFTTAVGTIVAGATDYTIQFVLTNGGQNGQFYVAGRTSVFATVLTTRSAI